MPRYAAYFDALITFFFAPFTLSRYFRFLIFRRRFLLIRFLLPYADAIIFADYAYAADAFAFTMTLPFLLLLPLSLSLMLAFRDIFDDIPFIFAFAIY